MSYPDPVYLGEKGEITSAFRPVGREPELKGGHECAKLYRDWRVDRGEVRALSLGHGAQYAGRCAALPPDACRVVLHPFGDGRTVQRGEVERGHAGDFLYVPEGGLHRFRNSSAEPASMLILFAPGASREAYFEGLAEVALGKRQFTPEEFKEFCERHDHYFV